MNDVSRACTRCRRPAVVARGSAAYCLECNQIMDWSEVIAEVQLATENTAESPPATPAPPAPIAVAAEPVREPVLSGGGSGGGGAPDPTSPDPFAKRLI